MVVTETRMEEMNARQLRERISDMLRSNFSEQLAELEAQFNQAMQLLERVETKPPRSDFLDLRVLILKEDQSSYNRIQNVEAIGAVYRALKLYLVGQEGELALACKSGPEYGGYVTELATFVLDDFPWELQPLCRRLFEGVQSFEFFVRHKTRAVENRAESTEPLLVLDDRAALNDAACELEAKKNELQAKMDATVPLFKQLLRTKIDTNADSDAELSDDPVSEDEDGRLACPSAKRKKLLCEVGKSRDTAMQKISLDGIEVSLGNSVKTTRVRDFRGELGPQFAELLGSFSTGLRDVIDKKTPKPTAPCFSSGAELRRFADGRFRLEKPGEDVNSSTAVTQKMLDYDADNGTTLAPAYEQMHDDAYALRFMISKFVDLYRAKYEFVVRAHNEDGSHADYNVDEELPGANKLSPLQKVAIGRLYLHAISVPKQEESAAEEEELSDAGEEEELSDGESGEEDYDESSSESDDDAPESDDGSAACSDEEESDDDSE